MNLLTRFLSPAASPSAFRFTPRMELLDDRIVPSFLTTLGSTKSDGTQGLANSDSPSISADGRFVAFETTSQLVAADLNATSDVYLKDRSNGALTLISVNGVGVAAGNSTGAAVSGSGEFVAFESSANTIVAGFGGGFTDIFVRNVAANTTAVASQRSVGGQANANSTNASISDGGTKVAFQSTSSNTVPGGFGGGAFQEIYVRDLTAGTTSVASVDGTGTPQNGASANARISGNGQFVAFQSTSSDLVTGFGSAAQSDIFVRNLTANTTAVANKNGGGVRANAAATSPDVSDDGRYVSFLSTATDLVAGFGGANADVFLRDMTANTTQVASKNSTGGASNSSSFFAEVSGNGRFVLFQTAATNIVTGFGGAGLFNAFVFDRAGGTTLVASRNSVGVQSNGGNFNPMSINRDGRFVAYFGSATDVVTPDTNGAIRDVFVSQVPTPALFAAGAAAGGSSQVNVYNAAGVQTASFLAYPPGYTGGVFVARGDATGDGVEEIVTSTGAGGSANIRVFSQAGVLLNSFFGYPEGFTGGVNVAIGDVNNDGFADILCGVGKGGGPNVRVFSGKDNGTTLLFSFFAYPASFTGGVRVAVADVNGDGFADIICGVGSGGGPNVRIYDGKTALLSNGTSLTLLQSFFALPETFTGGVYISAGDFDNNGIADIAVGVESGGGPNVRAYNSKTLAEVASFFGFDMTLTGGVKVASTDLNQDGFDDFVLGTGPGTTNQVKVISGKDKTTNLLAPFAPFAAFTGGVNVG